MQRSTKSFAVLIVTSFLFLNLVSAYGQSSAVEISQSVYINQTLLRSTIPSNIILGKSYTAQVYVTNNSTAVLSGEVLLNLPTYYFYTDNPTQPFKLLPGQSQDFYFRFVAGIPYTGQLNVTAAIILKIGSHLLPGESVSLPVYSIVHSSLVNYVWAAVIFGLIVAAVLSITIVFLRRRRKGFA